MKLTVSVTAEDIVAGKVKDCKRCPIALAIGRMLNAESNVEVQCNVANFFTCMDKIWKSIYMPDIAALFIAHFDRKQEVEPFTFELEIPNTFLNEHLYVRP